MVRTKSLSGNLLPYQEYETLPLSDKSLVQIYAISTIGFITQGDLDTALDTALKCIALGLDEDFYTKLVKQWVAANDDQVEIALDKIIQMQSADSEFSVAL